LILGLLLMGQGEGSAQFFSPGPLARPHAAFEGLDNCAKCHDQQQPHSPERCLACHTELGPGRAQHHGLHGRMAADTRDECQRCHPDHRGRDFQIVDWQGERQKFKHTLTGWALQGKHAQLRCEGCHDRTKLVAPEVVRMQAAQPGRTTYLGLSSRCDSCHFDEHRGQLSRDCQRCHNETAWRPVPGFNHDSSAFALRGKHKAVACQKCHPTIDDEAARPASAWLKPRASSFAQMKPIDHAGCASCHDDPHDGKLGPRCASCHTEAGWKVVLPSGGMDRAFHKRTAFPLLGAHIAVPCRSCHGPFPGSPARYKGLPFARCADCHEDAHVGQLTAASGKRAPDCASCHDVNAFSPPRFELEQHAQTKFPLAGAHRVTACRSCHPIDARLDTQVPVAIRNKLKRERRPLPISTAILRPKRSPERCAACHNDVHQGQFVDQVSEDLPAVSRRAPAGETPRSPRAAAAAEQDCRACHNTSSFSDLKFDHAVNSRFPLTGAHRTTPCAGCHLPEQIHPGRPLTVRYKPIVTACGSCHRDQHQGQFTWDAVRLSRAPAVRRSEPLDCSACHQTDSFKATLFSHADPRFTTFALLGQHAQAACGACHREVEVAPNVRTVRYRPLPRACAGCHVDFHKGDFRGFEP
jgi:hypothetical protein